ncbi:class I SAM-dependent methyltransferase [Dysgonomonas sp. ZJ279]|uniref:class I SAM-dependent methyltransferase n=1 Tax=Dysgonomonas sp. ZJ279 TaxID=2709796 RepID=UPI0013EB5431|nr:class I SAM-dependent methyltransferase [Dysgonomonas sp. ZJ279]
MITEIAKYWDKQSTIWREEKQEAWTLPETTYWLEYFKTLRPNLPGNRVLEVGTASGYFANILHLAGYEVTAVDLSNNMIEEAKNVSNELGSPIDYHVMDAQDLQFTSNQFDLVFTRLMTWTTPDVEKFYAESFKVLRAGGMFLNFDGDFGNLCFSQEGHERYPAGIMEQANVIKSKLDISKHSRPQRDVELLTKVGFEGIMVDEKAQNRILKESDDNSSLFQLTAIKPIS